MNKAQIDKEAEEAAAEVEKLRVEQETADAELLAKGKEPLISTDIDDLFKEETSVPATVPVVAPVTVETLDAATGDKAEIARLTAELARSEARFNSTFGNFSKAGFDKLTQELEEVKAKLAEKETPPPAAPAPSEVTANFEELKAEVGEKSAKIIIALQEQNSALAKSLADFSGQVKATGEKAGAIESAQLQESRRQYYASLAALIPDWQTINGTTTAPQDPRFTQFVEQVIPGTDETYDAALKRLHGAGNATKVAEIFSIFKKSVGQAAKPAGQTEEVATEATRTGGGAPPPAPKPTKPIYTQAEVDNFDRLYAAGKLKGDPAKIEARWNDIQDAIAEGRVKG